LPICPERQKERTLTFLIEHFFVFYSPNFFILFLRNFAFFVFLLHHIYLNINNYLTLPSFIPYQFFSFYFNIIYYPWIVMQEIGARQVPNYSSPLPCLSPPRKYFPEKTGALPNYLKYCFYCCYCQNNSWRDLSA